MAATNRWQRLASLTRGLAIGLALGACETQHTDSQNANGAGGNAAIAGAQAAPGAGGAGGSAATPGSQATPGTGGAGSAAIGAGSEQAGAPAPRLDDGPATYERVWLDILETKGCSSTLCHGGMQGNLSMATREAAYMNLVGVPAAGPACGMSGKLRVRPRRPRRQPATRQDRATRSPHAARRCRSRRSLRPAASRTTQRCARAMTRSRWCASGSRAEPRTTVR